MADSPAAGPLLATPTLLAALDGGSPVFVTVDDALVLSALNAAAGVTLTLTGRFLGVGEDRVKDIRQDFTPGTNRTSSSKVIPLGYGWLLDWSVVVTAGTPLVGQCFAIVTLQRGLASSALELTTLAQGYVTTRQRLFGPYGPSRGFLEDGGALRSITGTQPGAGAELSEVVPTNARWALIAFEADLVTAVAVSNRVPQLTFDDGANVYARSPVNQSETASQTWRNSWQQGIPQIFDATRFLLLTPIGCELMLGAGHRIRSVTVGIQAADQYSAPQYLVREWIEG